MGALHHLFVPSNDPDLGRCVKISSFCHSSDTEKEWTRGEILGKAQNFARTLMEMPSNKLTPTTFSEIAHHKQQHTNLPLSIKAQ